jgi:hypothetical protein
VGGTNLGRVAESTAEVVGQLAHKGSRRGEDGDHRIGLGVECLCHEKLDEERLASACGHLQGQARACAIEQATAYGFGLRRPESLDANAAQVFDDVGDARATRTGRSQDRPRMPGEAVRNCCARVADRLGDCRVGLPACDRIRYREQGGPVQLLAPRRSDGIDQFQ